MSENKKTWETTNIPNLIKNAASGRYYGRFTVSGKQKWVNLRTDVWSIAKIRLADERSRVERSRQAIANVTAGQAVMGELFAIYRGQINDRTNIKPCTKEHLLYAIDNVLKTWPEIADLAPGKVTCDAVMEWRNRISREGTGNKPPGVTGSAERVWGTSSATINDCVDAIRHTLEVAVDKGQIAVNPLQRRGIKLKRKPRKPNLPEPAKLTAIFDEIERAGKQPGTGYESADFCRFLAYTGCRLSEARGVIWRDVDFGRGIVHVRGTKTAAANREVPMVPAARALLERIFERRKKAAPKAVDGDPVIDPSTPLFAFGSARKALGMACRKLGVEALNHHDLRDAFATAAIEAGVDIPTVAAWLGHADGGALLMRVYAHHRRPHSLAQAAKVQF